MLIDGRPCAVANLRNMALLPQRLTWLLRQLIAFEKANRRFAAPALNAPWVRARTLSGLNELEAQRAQADEAAHDQADDDLETLHRTWCFPGDDRDMAFAHEVALDFIARFDDGEPSQAAIEHEVEANIRFQLGLELDLELSTIDHLELESRTNEIWDRVQHGPVVDVWTYAHELRCVRTDANGFAHATPVGRVYADLSGKDALRWLLHVEIEQTTGPLDPWRLDKEALGWLLKHPIGQWREFGEDDEPTASAELPYFAQRQHLEALGLLRHWEPYEYDSGGYQLLPTGTELLLEVSSAPIDDPKLAFIRTLLADDTLLTLQGAEAPNRKALAKSTGAEAAARLARGFVHEIRNALTPAKHAFGTVRDAARAQALELPGPALEKVERGFERTFAFLERQVRMTEAALQSPIPFRIVSAIREAIEVANGGLAELEPWKNDTDEPSITGYRARLVLAFENLIRNAQEAGAQRVLLAISLKKSEVIVCIDDDGPDIPADKRMEIFSPGFSEKPGGGRGLPLVKGTNNSISLWKTMHACLRGIRSRRTFSSSARTGRERSRMMRWWFLSTSSNAGADVRG